MSYTTRRDTTYFSLGRGKFEFLLGLPEREGGVCHAATVGVCQGANQVIESGTQLRGSLPNNEREHLRDFGDFDFDGIVNAVRLRLTHNEVLVPKVVDHRFRVLDVLIGPCDLKLRSV